MVVVAMTCSVALRTPDMINGSAHGSSTLKSTWLPVMPMPRAASRAAGSTFCTPAKVLDRIDGIASRTRTISVGMR